MKDYRSKNFKFGFGQHSGVIDLNKDKFELPRFPINEKYGELKRFESIINYFPLSLREQLILPLLGLNGSLNSIVKELLVKLVFDFSQTSPSLE